MKIALALLTAALSASAQSINTAKPDLIPNEKADYDTEKALIISKEGTYVCQDGFRMYVNVPAPKVPVKEDKQDHEGIFKVPDKARLFSTEKQKFIAICVQIK